MSQTRTETPRRSSRTRPDASERGRTPPALRRVVIEGVEPEIDGGRFPIKRIVGDEVVVEADVFADGHDAIACALKYRKGVSEPGGTGSRGSGSRPASGDGWREVPLEPLGNDRWRGAFTVTEIGRWEYTLEAWIDRFGTWRRDLSKRVEAGQDVEVELRIGAELVREAIDRVDEPAAERLREYAEALDGGREEFALGPELSELMAGAADRRRATSYGKRLGIVVDRERARFSAWYEMFPRSCGPGREHGTFADCEDRLPRVAAMGFDVLYLPPIHPIGHTHRKGPDNRPRAGPDDPGSPWAIGSRAGGHKAIHPELGTFEDFERFRRAAEAEGLELALDIAFQCSPDHPWVREHPEWFRHRPDGSIQYAENPPKKYEDIYPLDFDTESWRELWRELKSVFLFWIERDVRIFRVDNPHTKPFAFWEWCIGEIGREHPDVIFLSEAFTRPRVMHRLAKLGFTQSYTYFAWRNDGEELAAYMTGLTRTEAREYFRPNLWPNTPDILTDYVQTGGRPASVARLVLAATLGASYGIYGPPFERLETEPREPGSEEYLRSEKYEIRDWTSGEGDPDGLEELIARVNRIRRRNPALHANRSLRFHPTDNARLIAYSKRATSGPADSAAATSGRAGDRRGRGPGTAGAASGAGSPDNTILAIVNLDPRRTQSGWTDLDLATLGLDPDESFRVHDLLSDARYRWRGSANYVELNPHAVPAHIFRIERGGG